MIRFATTAFTLSLGTILLLTAPGCEHSHSAKTSSVKESKTISPDNEVDVPVESLPEAVTAGVLAAMPGGKITDAEREIHDGNTVYELDVRLQGKTFEVKVDEKGKVLSKEEETEQEGEQDSK